MPGIGVPVNDVGGPVEFGAAAFGVVQLPGCCRHWGCRESGNQDLGLLLSFLILNPVVILVVAEDRESGARIGILCVLGTTVTKAAFPGSHHSSRDCGCVVGVCELNTV